ncbi:Re/Si-specific NAD(P)(+) transhydrogenase subunit alpha [Flavimobilis sp. GY10621]|uniref:proton-translocating NAD(P)(+) transhydrogenase n=1 Tax=Flavimobilis rhizosphaerae TaxID=2775421 RepID=A0ABR9DPP7_9MICO|nr:Re/Si-specific NAD(P)(+) transhydrogenase subunit alpha [Flavimobilis rhizosphaerae]MBD9699098.1 Re/Si-specific NAD(P)(+) transhydrogenase subunit alpha [Flavimobilis rhizosphaerae]
MRIGVPKESAPDQRLVAATPQTVGKLVDLGYEVVVEEGAGSGASIPDALYTAAGAIVVDAAGAWGADVVITVDGPGDGDVERLSEGATLVARLAPDDTPELVEALRARGVTALNLMSVPRISRAQALDVLSTMSNVSGYRGIIEAAESYAGMFGGQVTAAGSTPPARVFVIGAGVAGLAALGAAGSLGAEVRAYDVRADVAEQIESMGATFVRVEAEAQESADGYAKELTADQEAATAAVYAAESAAADVVVTTALIRGKAPITITAEMVAAMKPGSVVVDLAASGGGNCELTVPGEKIVTDNGVTIIGYTDLPGRMPKHTSQLYGTNIVNLMKLLTPAKDGELVLDLEDVVQRGITVTRAGEILWPPPPVQVSATPAPAPAAPVEAAPVAQAPAKPAKKKGTGTLIGGAITAALVVAAVAFSTATFASHLTVFALAVVVGFYVVTGVTHSLHTPLMAQTNAISGIILVGSLLQIGSDDLVVTILAVVAATFASINIFGGFSVASRMLAMFQKEA